MEATLTGGGRIEMGRTAPPVAVAATALLDAEFDAFYATVHRYLLHRVFDRELAEELTAETFYRLVTSLRRVRAGRRELQMWLLRIATNLANSHYRRMRWRRLLLARWGLPRGATAVDVAVGNGATPTRAAQVRTAVAALPPKEQSVVVLRYYSHLSHDDMAEILGCQPEAVRTRLSRAIKRLRRRLGDAV